MRRYSPGPGYHRIIEVASLILVALTATVHIVFIAYVVAGGFVALRYPRTVALHVIAVVWGIGGEVLGWGCPLTSLERWARQHAGMESLPPEGFIAHYITGVLYPDDAVGIVRAVVCVTVLASWMLLLGNRRRARRRRSAGRYPPDSTGTMSVPHEHR